jgi:hypothetical protein
VSALEDSVVKLLFVATVVTAVAKDMVPQLVVATEVSNVQDVLLALMSQLSVAANSVVDSAITLVAESLISTATMLVSQQARVALLATALNTATLVVASIRIENTMATRPVISKIRTTVISTLSKISTRTTLSITTSLAIMVVMVVSTRTERRTTIHPRTRETRVATEVTVAMATPRVAKPVELATAKASTMMASVEPTSSSSRLRLRMVLKRSKIKAGLSTLVSLRLEKNSR